LILQTFYGIHPANADQRLRDERGTAPKRRTFPSFTENIYEGGKPGTFRYRKIMRETATVVDLKREMMKSIRVVVHNLVKIRQLPVCQK
jgi:hypothetical protein